MHEMQAWELKMDFQMPDPCGIGGIASIISVFLPWFSAKASALGMTSSISVNGLGSVSEAVYCLGF